MKKIRLIYNPGSGDRSFKKRLDHLFEEFQRDGFQVVPYKTLNVEDIDHAVALTPNEEYYAIAIAGGDGTINRVVNAMAKYNLNLPIGIFPWGTANDLAAYFNIYSGGLLTDVSQKIDINMKNTLGKLAYYLKGVEQLPNFRPIPSTFTTKQEVISEDIYLFMVFNGRSAGGFDMLAKGAKIDDGKIDLIAIKACPVMELIPLFFRILKGEHLTDDNVIYIKTDKLSKDCEIDVETDIDGEAGPHFPVDIEVIPKCLKIFVPKSV